jgi:Ran GTPase-activating protein (RanGAP) involved in mRNA processing and transport
MGANECRQLVRGLANAKCAVRKLDLSGNRLDDAAAEAIGTMLPNAPKLRELILQGCSLGATGIRQLFRGLANEKCAVRKLDLSWNHLDDAAAEAIGTMLPNAPKLRELNCSLEATGFHHLFRGLANEKCAVEELDLFSNALAEEEGAIILFQGLQDTRKLKKVVLRLNDINDAGARALADVLRHNSIIQDFALHGSRIGPLGAVAIADSMETNVSVKRLAVDFNRIGDDGAARFAHMLTINATLQALLIGTDFGKAGLDALVASLPDMRGLKSIELCTEFTSETGDAFVAALERNTTLEHVSFGEWFDGEWVDTATAEQFMPRMDLLTALNRGGRQLITEPEESLLPLNYWPTVLARSSENADVIFFFLCEKHDVLLVNSGTKELIAHLFSSLPFHD